MLSPEEVAWVDSFLSRDPEMSVSDQNSFKEALLETLNAQNHSSNDERDAESMTESFSKPDIPNVRKFDKTAIENILSSIEMDEESDDGLNNDNGDDFWSSHKVEDIFLPTYNENARDLGASDREVDFGLQAFELEQSTDDIFKVWDLGIPPEEDDDLVKQLKKALAENPVSDDSKTWKGLEDGSLDGLISGISDLALRPKSG